MNLCFLTPVYIIGLLVLWIVAWEIYATSK